MAQRTIAIFGPEDFKPNASTFPDPGEDGQVRRYLSFATNESADTMAFVAPRGITTPLTAVITYRMASATTNNVRWRVAVEAISDGDAVDTDAASSFDSNNDGSDATVPGTAGHIDQYSVTLTNNDSIAAGDLVRLRFTRITTTGTDATGDAQILAVELTDDGL